MNDTNEFIEEQNQQKARHLLNDRQQDRQSLLGKRRLSCQKQNEADFYLRNS